MRLVLTIVFFLKGFLFAVQTDYDVAVVGTSPISMLEAIYHIAKNERVLILEADEKCGGAWKSIDICGITHADLGCHLIGTDNRLKEFFKQYFGCKFICLEHPDQEALETHNRCANGYYFSEGCYELISHLQRYIESKNNTATVEHEATTSKIGEDQIFYLNQRGIDSEKAVALIINGYAREVLNQLPMEFAVEAQKLLSITLEGSVG